MKIYDKKLAYPYFVWMTLFTVVPLLIVVYYAFTDGNGAFTMENLASISGYGSVFARSLLLALIATVICLVDEFSAAHLRMDGPAQRERPGECHSGLLRPGTL